MTSFDLIIVLLIVLSVAFAAYRGAIREGLTLLALAVAVGAAWFGTPLFLSLLKLQGSFFAAVGVAAGVSVVSFAGAYWVLLSLSGRLRLAGRTATVNRVGGAVFGFVRAYLLIGLGFIAYGYYLNEDARPAAVNRAALLPFAKTAAAFVEMLAPEALTDPKLERTNDETPPDPSAAPREGYEQGARSGLDEIVSTVTTTDRGGSREAATAASDPDPIATLLTEPSRRPDDR